MLPELLPVSSQAYEVANRLDLIGPSVEQPEYNLFERKKVTAPTHEPPCLLAHHPSQEVACLLQTNA